MYTTKFISLVFGLVLLLLQLQVMSVEAECCGRCAGAPSYNRCPDGTPCGSGDYCCSRGPCNIFCCNCDGSCRRSALEGFRTNAEYEKILREYNEGSMNCMNIFSSVDVNNDGNITFIEWASSIAPSYSEWARLASRWAAFDVEGKGYLTQKEAYDRKA